jgi:hypothetical protein
MELNYLRASNLKKMSGKKWSCGLRSSLMKRGNAPVPFYELIAEYTKEANELSLYEKEGFDLDEDQLPLCTSFDVNSFPAADSILRKLGWKRKVKHWKKEDVAFFARVVRIKKTCGQCGSLAKVQVGGHTCTLVRGIRKKDDEACISFRKRTKKKKRIVK